MDYRLAQHASRRNGAKFKLDIPLVAVKRVGSPRKPSHIIRHSKLTRTQVREMRAWAQREGWGQSRSMQARILAERYRVSFGTAIDVLRNMSWFDATYIQGQCDKDYWGRLTPFVAMLRLMQPQQKAVA